jgi:hypothetical protein
MKTQERTLRVDMNELEFAFESRDDVFDHYLDTQTGQVLGVPGFAYTGDEDEAMDRAAELIESDPDRFLPLESDIELRPSIADAREFACGVEDEPFRQQLEAALRQPRGAFRRFLGILEEESGENERWHHERRQRLRDNIAAWLAARGINALYEPLPPFQPRNDVRRHLLAGAATFVKRVKQIPGVRRIAMISSMTTPKRAPNDIDLHVLTLKREVIAAPPLVIWPEAVMKGEIPADVIAAFGLR